MTSEDFARLLRWSEIPFWQAYFQESSITAVGEQIKALKLSEPQMVALRQIINGALTDMCYTLLLGIDGATSLGSLVQQQFQLLDEDDNILTGGELEGAASEIFGESQ